MEVWIMMFPQTSCSELSGQPAPKLSGFRGMTSSGMGLGGRKEPPVPCKVFRGGTQDPVALPDPRGPQPSPPAPCL